MIYTIIEDDHNVVMVDIEDEEGIVAILDSGFVSAVLRLTNEGIEYARESFDDGEIEWTEPEVRDYL